VAEGGPAWGLGREHTEAVVGRLRTGRPTHGANTGDSSHRGCGEVVVADGRALARLLARAGGDVGWTDDTKNGGMATNGRSRLRKGRTRERQATLMTLISSIDERTVEPTEST
jgi:hypothetical protein